MSAASQNNHWADNQPEAAARGAIASSMRRMNFSAAGVISKFIDYSLFRSLISRECVVNHTGVIDDKQPRIADYRNARCFVHFFDQ